MPERATKSPKTADRFARMLVVVPYFVQHPGTTLADAAGLFDVETDQLRKDLELLFLSGLPPYGPGDLIDVEIDEDDRVTIRMADHFARPLRLSRHEALALYLRGTELLGTPGLPQAPALRSAMEKLRSELGSETIGDPEGRIEATEAGGGPGSAPRGPRGGGVAPSGRDHVLRALERRMERARDRAGGGVREPRVAGTSRLGTSRPTPSDCSGWTGSERSRIRGSRSNDADSKEPDGRSTRPTDEDAEVRLRLKPAARWVGEYYAVTAAQDGEDGSLDVTLPVKRLDWVAGLLLRLGPDAEVLSPVELRERVRDLARRTLDRYGD